MTTSYRGPANYNRRHPSRVRRLRRVRIAPSVRAEADKATQTALENIGALTKEHNPANLTPEQIGVADGWRLLNADEGAPWGGDVKIPHTQFWSVGGWRTGFPPNEWTWNCEGSTLRTKLSPAELRKERGLEPKAEAIEAEGAEPSPEARAIAEKYSVRERLARQIDELVARKTAEFKADSDNLDAYGANLRGQIADLEKLLLATREALKIACPALAWMTGYCSASGIDGTPRHNEIIAAQIMAASALSLTPDSVRAKYVTAEELAMCKRERDEWRRSSGVHSSNRHHANERALKLESERDSLAARVKELEALEKPRKKHVEVLAELERVKEELAEAKGLFEKCSDELGKEMLSANQRQERVNELTRELSAANEAREKAEKERESHADLARESAHDLWLSALADKQLVISYSRGESEEETILNICHVIAEKLSAALTDKLEADATVERMREELEYGRKALANYGAAWQPQSLSLPRSTALREHDLALAERAWKEGAFSLIGTWLASDLYRELTKGEGK